MNNVSAHSRIAFLDGLRGIAIILVVLFHAYSRWPDIVPFGTTFAKWPIFAYGWLGVHLFFMISGFVIFMTLEKCLNFQEFILRRWFRLFPAMLVCSAIIFITIPLLPERPAGQANYYDLLPGLTFIAPSWWSELLGFKLRGIEGAFWSLYVEAKFYFIFGLLYFLVGWRKAVIALVILFSLTIANMLLIKLTHGLENRLLSMIINIISAQYYGWFAAGALYYKYYCTRRTSHLIYAVSIALISALAESGLFNLGVKLPAILVCLVFTLAIMNTRTQKLLTHPSLLFLGFISYPLYLLHENMMVAMIVKVGRNIPAVSAILIPLIPIIVVIGISWLVTNYLEPWTREQLRLPYNKFSILIGKLAR